MISDTEPSIPDTKRRQRRFIQDDLDRICELLTKRHSEAQACELIGIKPDSFYSWKARKRNSSVFASTFTRARAIQLNNHVENIEDAALANGIFTKPDWRASESLIKLKFPELYPQPGLAPAPQVTVQIGIIHEQLKRVIGFNNVSEATLIDDKIQSVAQATIKMPVRTPATP